MEQFYFVILMAPINLSFFTRNIELSLKKLGNKLVKMLRPAQMKPLSIQLKNKVFYIYLNKDGKKGLADPFFQFSVLNYPFYKTYHERANKF